MNPRNILIVNPFGIGDVLFSTPLVKAIAERFPDTRISYVCNNRVYGVMRNNPHLTKVYVFEKDHYRKLWKESKLKCLRRVSRFLGQIRRDRYDMVIDLSCGDQVGLVTALLGIPIRMGFNYKGRGRFLTHKFDMKGFTDKHVIEYCLSLGGPLGITSPDKRMELVLSNEDKAWASSFLVDHGVAEGERLCGIIPGCGASWGKNAKYRRWSPWKFAEVADHIAKRYGYRIIVFGEDAESGICEDVVGRMASPAIQSCGRTTVSQFAALLDHCDLIVTNDGGPLHVAVALQKRVVALFGPVDEKVYGPYPPDKRFVTVTGEAPCRPCYRSFKHALCDTFKCLESISSAMVVRVVDEVMAERAKENIRI